MGFHLEQLLSLPQVKPRNVKEVSDYLRNHEQYHLIFVYGFGSEKPQAIDLCVILKELLICFSQLSLSIITEDTEDEYRRWAQIQARPSLALMYGLYQCEKITKLVLWNEYMEKINQSMKHQPKQFKKLAIL